MDKEKLVRKLFKRKKKYKLILTEDEMFLIGPIVLMWIEDWKEELKKEDYSGYNKEIAERDIKVGWSMISKIKKAQGR